MLNLNLISAVITLIVYYYFNYCYFRLVGVLRGMGKQKKGWMTGTFVLNYMLFVVCSVAELNLIWNWAAFFLFLLAETNLYCREGGNESAFFSFIGILCGLTINIFSRCVIAILIAQPLSNFDNHVTSAENLKGIPVSLGFFLAGIVFRILMRPMPGRRIRTLLGHSEHLSFVLKVMAGMFLYLFLNLLIYHTTDNGLLLKLWGIKSCVFVTVGTYLGIRFSQQMCDLSDYRSRNHLIRQELLIKSREEETLLAAAYEDALTACYTRLYADRELDELQKQGRPFSICFADLDGLKQVNDRYGHEVGDRYLVAAAKALNGICGEQDILTRYGGDEFLVLFPELPASMITERLQAVDRKLRESGESEAYPFPMSLSFGVAESREGGDLKELLRIADKRMYERKKYKLAATTQAED